MNYKLTDLLPGFLLVEALEDKVKVLSEKYKIDPKKIEEWAEFDPTTSKTYLDWMCKMTIKGEPRLRLPEDGESVKEVLSFFDRYKHRFQIRDINAYKSFHQLRDLYRDMNDKVSSDEKQEKYRKTTIPGARVFYQDGKYKIIEISSVEAAKFYSDSTEWCTLGEGYAKQYLNIGGINPQDNYLYVIFINGVKMYQAYFGDSGPQVKDIKDYDVPILQEDQTLCSIFEKKFEEEASK
jgi:hypothetical protein